MSAGEPLTTVGEGMSAGEPLTTVGEGMSAGKPLTTVGAAGLFRGGGYFGGYCHQVSLRRQMAWAMQFIVLQKGTVMGSSLRRY